MPDRILILRGWGYGHAVSGLGRLTANVRKFMKKPKAFKLVLFTGGEDVDPSFYGDTSPLGVCRYNTTRDRFEQIIFKQALKHGIKMAGICRGLQFLSVMDGGKLVHHLDNHAGVYHGMECLKDNITRKVNSLHHQMVIPSKDSIVVGWSKYKLSGRYFGDGDRKIKLKKPEVEATIMPNILACGVQWHPEMMAEYLEGYKFFREMVKDLLEMDMKDFVEEYTTRKEERDARA